MVPYALVLAAHLLWLQHRGQRRRGDLWHLQACTPALWALLAFVIATGCMAGASASAGAKPRQWVSHHYPSMPWTWQAQKFGAVMPPWFVQSLSSLASVDASVVVSVLILVVDMAVANSVIVPMLGAAVGVSMYFVNA